MGIALCGRSASWGQWGRDPMVAYQSVGARKKPFRNLAMARYEVVVDSSFELRRPIRGEVGHGRMFRNPIG